ncbi:MAG: hypothetical protein IJQ36_05830 [Oscillospiraceae bacterium]|nr:hypothetical protein [Oscillospiraceae bacterium]MBQ7143754.1 hypothetical protein [Oscillospiraceae bacterium]
MKLNKDTIYTLWSIAILILVLISIFALFFAACAKQETKTSFDVQPVGPSATIQEPREEDATQVPQQAEETSSEEPETVPTRLEETADAGRAYLDRITFLGDSTTYGIGYYYGQGYSELCPDTQIWTPASGTLTLSYHSIATIVYPETGEEISIVEAATRSQPDILLITLGVNGVSFMDEAWFISDYTTLVESIRQVSPDTKIILNSIYPVAASYKLQNEINNDKIRAANGWIERVAEETGCRYLNSYEAVVGPDGNLPESSHNGDGMHLTGEAFTKVMQFIRTHALE